MVQELEDLMDSFLKLRDLKRSVKLDLRINCKMGLLLAMAPFFAAMPVDE